MRLINQKWNAKPGNWDPLRALETVATEDFWGIPTIPAPKLRDDQIPDWMVCCDDWSRFSKAGKFPKEGAGACHFFTDDYRFEAFWNNPPRQLARLHDAPVMTSPDYSLYRDHPLAIQIWNTYRNRWVGRKCADAGRIVIPTIGWSDANSYDFCFRGVERGSMVVVSTVGTQGSDDEAKELFVAGYQEMVDRILPELVIVYGSSIPDEIEDIAPYKVITPFQVFMAERMKAAPKSYEQTAGED